VQASTQILIVDDDFASLAMHRDVLVGAGFDIDIAQDGSRRFACAVWDACRHVQGATHRDLGAESLSRSNVRPFVTPRLHEKRGRSSNASMTHRYSTSIARLKGTVGQLSI
jgi:hypothetical protein